MDYNKYIYDKKKKQKKEPKKTTLKEIKFGINIADHDLQTRANKTIDILNKGDRVKVAIQYKGREKSRMTEGKELMDKFISMVGKDTIKILKNPKMEGNMYSMIIELA